MGAHAKRPPCPFCGCVYTDMKSRDGQRPKRQIFYVQCSAAACKGRGPEGDSRQEATEGWEERYVATPFQRRNNVVQLRIVK